MTHPNDFLLNEYLDGVLDEDTQRNVASHLAACADCRARAGELEAVFAALDAVPDVPLQTDLSPRIVAELEQAREPAWLRPVLVAQALAALALLVWLWPTMQAWLAPAGEMVRQNWDVVLAQWAITLPTWQPAGGLATRWEQIRPGLALPALQWGILFGLALVAWVLGNGLFMRKLARGEERSEH